MVHLLSRPHPAPVPPLGQLTIRVNNMEVAGEIIQDLCSFLTINELESVADFPQEFEEFKKVLMKVTCPAPYRMYSVHDTHNLSCKMAGLANKGQKWVQQPAATSKSCWQALGPLLIDLEAFVCGPQSDARVR